MKTGDSDLTQEQSDSKAEASLRRVKQRIQDLNVLIKLMEDLIKAAKLKQAEQWPKATDTLIALLKQYGDDNVFMTDECGNRVEHDIVVCGEDRDRVFKLVPVSQRGVDPDQRRLSEIVQRYGMILSGNEKVGNGNSPEFKGIRIALRQRKIKWCERIIMKDGEPSSIFFWMDENELRKLPTDFESTSGSAIKLFQFLPISDYRRQPLEEQSGHGIAVIDRMLDSPEWAGEDVTCS